MPTSHACRVFALFSALSVALVMGCGGSGDGSEFQPEGADSKGDGGSSGPSKGFTEADGGRSDAGNLKCKPSTCAAQGVSCGPAGDGCGGVLADCGTCEAGFRCGGPGHPSTCVAVSTATGCTPKTCAEQNVLCGPAGDGCGGILACGSCSSNEQCGATGKPSQCVPNLPVGADGGVCMPKTCADFIALGMDCGKQSDGCGGSIDCGGCTAPAFCGGSAPSKCGVVGGGTTCTPKTCADFPGINCGRQPDGCGGTTDDCGTCTSPQICGGGGTPSVCGGGTVGADGGSLCTPKTCANLGKDCGTVSDGCGGVLDCGSSCPSGQVCGGGGTANVCATPPCTRITSCSGGMDCGSIADGCGGIVSCGGSCTAPAICGGGGQPNVCGGGSVGGGGGGTCTPATCTGLGKDCGPVADGCGGLLDCGTCTGPDTCGGGGTASVCGGGNSCTPTTCAALGKNCGPVADGCGGLLDCGTCQNGAVCGGLGTANVCSGTGPGGGPCTGLCAQQTTCPASGTTSVSGVVYAPNGTLPIYDAIVYVPSGTVDPFPTTGVTCDQCSAQTAALISTKTNYKGEFVLPNMPVGSNIPLVIQVGRWRRQIVIPTVSSCVDTPLTMADTRLPRTQAEGDIPKLAVATGGADALQCLLRKMGVDDSEFTQPADAGRIHLYAGANGGTSRFLSGFNGYSGAARTLTAATALWASPTEMAKYDAMVLTCEGINDRTADLAPYRANVKGYADAGGRIFASHWHHAWLEDGPAPWPTTATFNHLNDLPSTITADINTTFPKGSALADWLVNAGSAQPRGKLSINAARHSIEAINDSTSTKWVYVDPPTYSSTSSVQYFTVNTPVGTPPENQCGRMVVSDLHVAAGDSPTADFPNGCTTTTLSDQEKALVFMLFDLTACVQADVPPTCTPKTCVDQGFACGLAGDGCGGQIDCGTCSSGQTCGGGGIASQCGGPTCTPRTCVQQNATCGTVPDGCGSTLDCGTCGGGETCGGGGTANQCGAASCTASTCLAQGISCGSAGDGCGGVLDCGSCPSGQTCGGGGTPGVCGAPACTPLTQCPAGKDCGQVPDGCGGILTCGTCPGGQECGGGGSANVCGAASCSPKNCMTVGAACGLAADGCGSVLDCGGCDPTQLCSANQCITPACTKTTCVAEGVTCGPLADGCGGLLQCGTCSTGQTCGGGGTPGHCGSQPCAPKTCADLGAVCGQVADGCGALTPSCGTCSSTQSCSNGTCVNACVPKTCATAGANCGFIADGCGASVNCGTCAAGTTCGGGGTSNVCGNSGPK